jgi:hypothetical protein
MKADELAEELAEFWFSAIDRASWDRRLEILQEIDAQLIGDLERRSDYEAVWPRFVAAVIDRLGAPAVTHHAQAKIYASSANPNHREAASAWTAQGANGQDGAGSGDRRRFARQTIDGISEIWVRGHAASCRLVDLSPGGARVLVEDAAPVPGTQVRLAVPSSGVRSATVVFRNQMGIGLEFSDRPAAA